MKQLTDPERRLVMEIKYLKATQQTVFAKQLHRRDSILAEQIFLRERARLANERKQLLNVPV